MSWLLRRYDPNDLPALRRCYADGVRHHGPRAYTSSQIMAWANWATSSDFSAWIEDSHCVIVADASGAGGFAGLTDNGRISALYLHPRACGHGQASRLLTCLISLARQRGLTALTTEASAFSRQRFRAHGFIITHEETVTYDDVAFLRWCMRLNLKPVDECTQHANRAP